MAFRGFLSIHRSTRFFANLSVNQTGCSAVTTKMANWSHIKTTSLSSQHSCGWEDFAAVSNTSTHPSRAHTNFLQVWPNHSHNLKTGICATLALYLLKQLSEMRKAPLIYSALQYNCSLIALSYWYCSVLRERKIFLFKTVTVNSTSAGRKCPVFCSQSCLHLVLMFCGTNTAISHLSVSLSSYPRCLDISLWWSGDPIIYCIP